MKGARSHAETKRRLSPKPKHAPCLGFLLVAVAVTRFPRRVKQPHRDPSCGHASRPDDPGKMTYNQLLRNELLGAQVSSASEIEVSSGARPYEPVSD